MHLPHYSTTHTHIVFSIFGKTRRKQINKSLTFHILVTLVHKRVKLTSSESKLNNPYAPVILAVLDISINL